uniref:Dynamin_M domain-containing protein n=1 Tax=Gongylonema pulchrum TaxID=637853 RepID=A0A183EJU8_9BILA
LDRGIEIVRQFQLLRAPKFTEIGTIAEQRQLEFINGDLGRIAGESMYAYLSRIRQIALPSLSETICERIGLLAEHCRFRHQPFGEAQLTETRTLIKEIVKMLTPGDSKKGGARKRIPVSDASRKAATVELFGFDKKQKGILAGARGRGGADEQRMPLIVTIDGDDDKKTKSDHLPVHRTATAAGSRLTTTDTYRRDVQNFERTPLIV